MPITRRFNTRRFVRPFIRRFSPFVARKLSARRIVRASHVALKRQFPNNKDSFAGPPTKFGAYDINNKFLCFPPEKWVQMQYSHDFTVTGTGTTAATGTEIVLQLNSLYSPEASGGHQPRYFDQLTPTPYKKYRVYEVGVRVTFLDPSSVTCYGCLQVRSSQDSSTVTVQNGWDVAERPGGWRMQIPGSGTRQCNFCKVFKIWEIEGMSYNQWLADDGFDANYSANPAAITKLALGMGDYAIPTSNPYCYCIVDMTFKARLYGASTATSS